MNKGSSRSYSDRTLKILWGRAAGRCAIPTCRMELFAEATEHDPIVTIGDIAHIESSSDAGPRADAAKGRKERDGYDNLILLCLTCHRRLDGQKNSNSVEHIKKLRADHEAWVRNSLPERGRSTTGWAVILLQGAYPFDLEPAISALVPDFPSGEPVVVKADPDKDDWAAIQRQMKGQVATLLDAGDPFDFRLAVFPLAPVSACLALGYYLTDRPRVRHFEYYADDHSWAWPESTASEGELSVSGLPDDVVVTPGEVAIYFHLSATIIPEAPSGMMTPFLAEVHISVSDPGTGWLQSELHLKALARTARRTFETCQSRFPKAARWHVFFAGLRPEASSWASKSIPPCVRRSISMSIGGTVRPHIVPA